MLEREKRSLNIVVPFGGKEKRKERQPGDQCRAQEESGPWEKKEEKDRQLVDERIAITLFQDVRVRERLFSTCRRSASRGEKKKKGTLLVCPMRRTNGGGQSKEKKKKEEKKENAWRKIEPS